MLPQQEDCNILSQIICSHNVAAGVLAEALWAVRGVLCSQSRLQAARRYLLVFLRCPGLLQDDGTICALVVEQLFGKPDLIRVIRDILGAMCVLAPRKARLLVPAASQLASLLGSEGAQFLSDMFRVACPPASTDRTTLFAWWQLPSIPLEQEVAFSETSGSSRLDALPSVRDGEPYPDITAYLSTYMRLHRADCFHDITGDIQQLRKLQKHGLGNKRLLLTGIVVCRLVVSEVDGALQVHLAGEVPDPGALRYNSLAIGNLVAVSLRGSFDEPSLIWGMIKAGPSAAERAACNAAARAQKAQQTNPKGRVGNGARAIAADPRRVTFEVQWCADLNDGLTVPEVLEALRSHHPHSCLIENPVSFVAYGPVLSALRTLWRPGSPTTIPFMETLLSGRACAAEDKDVFMEAATSNGFMAQLDASQAAAMESVARHTLALIQGPPGTGKSFLASRIARILSETQGRLLVITSKNHALDEILTDIDLLNGNPSQPCFIRIGNRGKIAQALQQRSLQAVTPETKQTADTGARLRKVTARCKAACASLFEPISLTSGMVLRASGETGILALRSLLNRLSRDDAAEYLAGVVEELSPDEVKQADMWLSGWARVSLHRLKERLLARAASQNLVVYASGLDEEGERLRAEQEGTREQDDAPADSFFSLLMCMGPGNGRRLVEPPGTWMIRCPQSCRDAYVLSLLQHEVRARTGINLEIAAELSEVHKEAEAAQQEAQAVALRSVPVIGATMMGALLHMEAISAAEPAALLLEEAGEIPEASVISLLRMPSLKRCVMVGDHKQLRPSVHSHQLRVHKKLDISCFERLVNLGMPVPCLLTQNRMRPDVMAPVLQHYADLQSNHQRVSSLEEVPWLARPLFWWECETEAERMDSSWCNKEQGQRASRLAGFLVKQQAATLQQITILVPYSSQLLYIRMLLREGGLADVTCSTVDQYQGDENDVIILLLVRCDHSAPEKLGFMAEVNRMIVATSRQRKALVILGSSKCFATHEHWNRLLTSLRGASQVGGALPLRCPRHPHTVVAVPDACHFPPSGCGQGCGGSLSGCSHKCTLKCHSPSEEHGLCKVVLRHVHEGCGHVFEYACHAVPASCPQPISLQLRCGHAVPAKCGMRGDKLPACRQSVEQTMPCGHSIWLPCGTSSKSFSNQDFNTCPVCMLHLISPCLRTADLLGQRGKEPTASKGAASLPFSAGARMNQAQIKAVADSAAQASLCHADDIPMLERALEAAAVPYRLAAAAFPDSALWDPNTSAAENARCMQAFADEQSLWRLVLQEAGVAVPVDWQKQSLTLLAGAALVLNWQGVTTAKDRGGIASLQGLDKILRALRKAGISTSESLVNLMRKADAALYKALSENKHSGFWYGSTEPQLAAAIVHRLKEAALGGSRSMGAEEACAPSANGDKQSESSRKANVLLADALSDDDNTGLDALRKKWGLLPGRALNSPPHAEVPKDYLYRRSLAGSLYISIDLKSADFHVLRLAAPELVPQTSWNSFVIENAPDLASKVCFLPEMKPLRVRVLGKVLHKKNAALQSHCLRLIARLLLTMASDHPSSPKKQQKLFRSIDCVFRFSCDELCLKLANGTGHKAALALADAIQNAAGGGHWDALLPVRVEVFELALVPLSERVNSMWRGQRSAADDEEALELHAGHPALRVSAQFVDKAAVHDPAWAEPSLPPLPASEQCSDGYFERRLITKFSKQGGASASVPASNAHVTLKALPAWARPTVLLEKMHKQPESKDRAVQAATPTQRLKPADDDSPSNPCLGVSPGAASSTLRRGRILDIRSPLPSLPVTAIQSQAVNETIKHGSVLVIVKPPLMSPPS